ncbi:hypothetical protein ACLOJK_014565 [Asimina triloba]
MRKFTCRQYIREDFPIFVRTLLRMSDLKKNFYKVVSSSGASYVKSSSAGLTIDERDFYLSLQPCLLPLRDEGLFHLESYFPHRFAHHFGYDQGVPKHLVTVSHEALEIDEERVLEPQVEPSNSSEEACTGDDVEAASPRCGFKGTPQETTPNIAEGMTVDRTSPIRRAVDAGSARSMGELPEASEGDPSAARMCPTIAGSDERMGEMPNESEGTPGFNVVHDLDDVSLPSMDEIFGNLDVDHVDQPFEPLGANVSLFFDVSFILAYEGPPTGSPPSVQWISLRGIPEIEEFAHRVSLVQVWLSLVQVGLMAILQWGSMFLVMLLSPTE